MIKKYLIPIFFLELLTAQLVMADDVVEPLTLQQAENIALKNYFHTLSIDSYFAATNQDSKAINLTYLPQISKDAMRVYANDGASVDKSRLGNSSVINPRLVGIGVSQLITDFGKTASLDEAAKFEVESQKQNRRLACNVVLLNVIKAYYNVLEVKQTMRMSSKLSKFSTNLNDYEATLSQVMGYSENRKFQLSDDKKIIPLQTNLNKLLNSSLRSNPEILSLKAQMRMAKQLDDVRRKEFYPTVTALGFAGNTPLREASQKMNSDYMAAGINIGISFYTGGNLNVGESQNYQEKKLSRDLEARKNQILSEVRTAFDNAAITYRALDIANQNLKNANQALILSKAKYEIGKISIANLKQARLAKTKAEIIFNKAKYDYLVQNALLEFSAGIGEFSSNCSIK